MISSIKLLTSGLCRAGLNREVMATRLMATTSSSAATDSPMARLRRKTGYAFTLCRKALEIHSQDIEKAEQWLRAEAAKQGWERAQRVSQRATADGLIGVFRSADKRMAAMLEINCETDFVARNQLFTELATVLTKSLAERRPTGADAVGGQHFDSGAVVSKWFFTGEQLSSFCPELVVDAIGKLGENIRLSKACLVSTGNASEVKLIGYSHAVGGRVPATDEAVLLGKYGTIIALKAGI
jgi:elongation factor Ts